MSDAEVIRHCAPTLAGLKTGSIFTSRYESKQSLFASLRRLNRKLKQKGLRAIPLRVGEHRAMIYLFRPVLLRRDISDNTAAQLLAEQGYPIESIQRCVARLTQRIRSQEEFPHEIGLFLGYPPEDVRGFIQNKACGCKCVGCWKVYGDEEKARRKFEQFHKCTRVYCDCWRRGSSLERLTVSS